LGYEMIEEKDVESWGLEENFQRNTAEATS
jgi:hypothetical protein